METECTEPGCQRRVNRDIEGRYCVDHRSLPPEALKDPNKLDPRKMGPVDASIALTYAIHRLCDLVEKGRIDGVTKTRPSRSV